MARQEFEQRQPRLLQSGSSTGRPKNAGHMQQVIAVDKKQHDATKHPVDGTPAQILPQPESPARLTLRTEKRTYLLAETIRIPFVRANLRFSFPPCNSELN